ncbi:MAG: ribonuclease HII [Solobacterium sp.]|nr:ribonuclease HII [Solobacterium sp.]
MSAKTRKICTNEYEHAAWERGRLLLGLDEAGRGPLAGPLSVAGVVFEPGYENPDIYDSKALSEKKREQLYETILEDALYFFIEEVTPEEIDRYNILMADRMAMMRIAECLPCGVIVTDCVNIVVQDKEIYMPAKGDQLSVSVAAASILAKVTRDRLMYEYDALYPQYGFAKNKGYPTKAHMEAIERYGITPIHRRSFGPVAAKQISLDLF